VEIEIQKIASRDTASGEVLIQTNEKSSRAKPQRRREISGMKL
jgi:hypothetical protein